MKKAIDHKVETDPFKIGRLLTEAQLSALESEGLDYSHRTGNRGNTMVFSQGNQIVHMTQTPIHKYRICYTGYNGNGQTGN